MSRMNQILIALLVIQIALTAVIFWPRPVAEAQGGPLFADFEAAKVAAFSISDGEGNRLALARSGEQWVLPKAGNFPADAEKITPFLEKIGAVKSDRLVTQTDSSHRRLEVADDAFNRLVELTLDDGANHQLFIGSSAGAAATHVRADDRLEVYLTGDVTSWDANAQAAAWIDTLYFTLPLTATVALTLENENGTFEFEKEGETWMMKGLAEEEILNESAVTSLINQASSIRMAEPIGTVEQDSFGLDDPLAIITLTTVDDTYSLQVGARNEENNNYILSSSDSPYYVWVAQFTGDNFLNKTRSDFLEAPVPAEAGGGIEATD